MHKNSYKIKVVFSCDKNFSKSIEELKPFFGFDLNEIQPSNDTNSLNSSNQVLIVDSSHADGFPFEKVSIPKILILKQNEKDASKDKFNSIIRLPIYFEQFNKIIIERFFSESPSRMLIHPKYGLKNFEVKDLVDKRLEERDTYQGRLFQVSN